MKVRSNEVRGFLLKKGFRRMDSSFYLEDPIYGDIFYHSLDEMPFCSPTYSYGYFIWKGYYFIYRDSIQSTYRRLMKGLMKVVCGECWSPAGEELRRLKGLGYRERVSWDRIEFFNGDNRPELCFTVNGAWTEVFHDSYRYTPKFTSLDELFIYRPGLGRRRDGR